MIERGYARFSLGVLLALSAAAILVGAGYGLPAGSLFRRMTGEEGPTGGLTRAMREMLRGNVSRGIALHRAAFFVFIYLVAQIGWRTFIVLRWRPSWPRRIWVGDLIASMLLFAAAIYMPWWTR